MVLGLGGSKKKGTPIHFAFDITLNEVKPWPSKSLPPLVSIHWQRGEKRTGSTKPISTTSDRDRLTFKHTFTIPATLYKLSESSKRGSPRFQKKCIIFTLCHHSANSQNQGPALGRAVLDLSDYASLNRSAVSSVPVAVAKKEFSTLGTPHLSFSISPEGVKTPAAQAADQAPAPAESEATEAEKHASLIAALVSDDEEDIAEFTDEEQEDEDDRASVSSRTKDSNVNVNVVKSSSPPPPPVPVSSPPPPSPSPPSPSPPPTSTPPSPPPTSSPPSPPPPPVSSSPPSTSKSPSAPPAAKSLAAATAVQAYATAAKKRASFNSSSSSSNLVKGDEDDGPNSNPSRNVLQAARAKYAEAAGERSERLDKKAVEEARQRAAAAEARAAAAVERSEKLKADMEDMKSELRDAAALELALYSVVAQHGSSAQKIHASARRLARMYLYTCRNSSEIARASTARSCASGLVVVVRACENDVSRLTFWWSNVVVLREMISQELEVKPVPPSPSPAGELDWREAATLTSTLERIEAWIFGRIVECIWWQSLTPNMQSAAAELSLPSTPTGAAAAAGNGSEISVVARLKKSVRGLVVSDLGGSRQGNISIDIWKSAFLDALQRICPVRAGGHDCGCLQIVSRMIVEQCVARLDVAMFNAILRDMEENVPTDPISDPITELAVLPISPDNVSFGGGAQLKNVINTWSTWLLTLTADPGAGEEAAAAAAAQENVEKGTSHFTLLRAMSDLLMLPKDMLMDKSVRKEVCPALSLLLIRRVLSKFVPDEFSPEPVTPSLLAALNAEISMERQRIGEDDISPMTVIMASAPPVVYFPPSSSMIRSLLNGSSSSPAPSTPRLSRSASLFRKGHTSDDELEEIESPLFLLVDNAGIDPKEAAGLSLETVLAKRYRLLRQVWNS